MNTLTTPQTPPHQMLRCMGITNITQGNYCGALIIVSGESVFAMHAATEVAQLRQFSLLGSLQKPFCRDALSTLISKLAYPCTHS